MKKFFTFVTVAAMAFAAQAETFTVGGVSFNMVKVEAGTFTMGAEEGAPNDDNYRSIPAHEVTLTNDYFIGQTEVTQELWLAVMGNNPSWFTSEHCSWITENDLSKPVEHVSWYDCQEFISKLNEMTGKQFRLPTEAEWEYAARGGNKCQGFYYAGSNDIDAVAWYYTGVGYRETHPVGTKAPNELDLYDMTGNVWEWVNDWLDYYSPEPQTNPTGPENGTERIARGGSVFEEAQYGYLTTRFAYQPENRNSETGLRLALTETAEPVEPTEKTGAPTFRGYTEDGIHGYFVEIIPTEESVIYYRVIYPDGTESEWVEYEEILSFEGDGKYRVEAYAVAEGKQASEQIAYEFVVSPITGVEEMTGSKQVANVRYFNMTGQEMTEANGLTIVVTTYTDGTTSAIKVVK